MFVSAETDSPPEDPEKPEARPRRRLGRLLMDTRPLQVVPFRRLWLATAVTSIGSQLTAVAVPKQVYDITNSSGWVGIAGAVALVPLLVFGLWGGAIADTVDRRKLLLLTSSGIAMTSRCCSGSRPPSGSTRSGWCSSCSASSRACSRSTSQRRNASIARLVPAELLPQAGALNGTVFSVGAVLGPLLAGALIPFIGLSTLYLIDAIGLCLTLWAVWRLPALPPLVGQTRRAGHRRHLRRLPLPQHPARCCSRRS